MGRESGYLGRADIHPHLRQESQSFGKDRTPANCDHDPVCLLCAREHEPDNNFHPGKGHGLQRAQFSDNVVWSAKRALWRELLMFTTLNQTLVEFIPTLYLFWSTTDTVCVCVYLYTCMCVSVHICVCACMYRRVVILQPYPFQLTPRFLSSYSRVFPSTAWPARRLSWLPSVSMKGQKIMLDERLCLPSWAGRTRRATDICLQYANKEPSKRKLTVFVFVGCSFQSLEVLYLDKLLW